MYQRSKLYEFILYKEYKVYENNLLNHHALFTYKRSIFNKRTIDPFIYFLKWKLYRKIEKTTVIYKNRAKKQKTFLKKNTCMRQKFFF